MREISSDDLIVKTARHIGTAEEIRIFRHVAEQKGFTNWFEVARNWFLRWYKYGELSPCVREYCERELEARHATI